MSDRPSLFQCVPYSNGIAVATYPWPVFVPLVGWVWCAGRCVNR